MSSRLACGSRSTTGSTACCAAQTMCRRPCRIFRSLGTELVLRSPETPRRRESMWRHQYQLLLDLQRSPANRHPNPKFQLDQLTTACVALCRAEDGSGAGILRQARRNMAERSLPGGDAPPG